MAFDGGKPLDAGISKSLPTFCNGFEKLHTSKINSCKEDDHHIGYKLKFFEKKNTKVGIVFWVKFRQMTIVFLQIGEILVLFEFF